MKLTFRRMTISVVSLLLSAVGCGPKFENRSGQMTFEPIKIPSLDAIFNACSKPESEQTFSEEALAHRHKVSDKINNQDFEIVDCNGKFVEKGHGPVRSMVKAINIPAPKLSKKLAFVDIKNSRTCTMNSVWAGTRTDESLSLPNGKKIKIKNAFTEVDASGAIKLSLDNGRVRTHLALNVVEGANVIQINYFACLGEIKTEDGFKKCEKSELIAQKELIADVKIEHVEISGKHVIKDCEE